MSPTVAFLDARAGVAGDMWLGALLDAGLPLAFLEGVPGALGLEGVRVEARRVRKGALAATKVDVVLPGGVVEGHEHVHGDGPAHADAPGHGDAHGTGKAAGRRGPRGGAGRAHARGPGDEPGDGGPDVGHAHPQGRGDEPRDRGGASDAGHAHPHERPSAAAGRPVPAIASRGGRRAHAHETRGLAEVLAVVRGARGLPAEALADAVRTFTVLAEAEAKVHGVSPDEVHFHEVGALDALVDVVGVCAGLRRLGVVEVRVSPLPWFSGEARMAHGALPLPAPAVVHLLAGHPTYPSGETFEQVTPTGAALVRALSRGTAPPEGFVPRAVGVGAGSHPGGRLPNVVRLVVGEAGAEGGGSEDAVLLETNLDDATGQQLARAMERALAAGALDAWATPVVMKKGRPGTVLSVLAPPAAAAALEAVLFRETPTLGVRRRAVARTTLPRRLVPVPTPYGPIHVKVRSGPDGEEATPEHDECRAAADRAGVPLRAVQDAALRSWSGHIR